MHTDEGRWDASQSQALAVMDSDEHILVTGEAGTGKTSVALEAMRRALHCASPKGCDTDGFWAPALLLVPDRRRAAIADTLLAQSEGGRRLSGLHSDGSHRLVRSLASYAYLVLGLWLVERERAEERPSLSSGAQEDAWVERWLAENGSRWEKSYPPVVRESPVFRMEVRNLIARSGQAGLLATDLHQLGQDLGLPMWEVAGEAYEEYGGGSEAMFGPFATHLDAARIPVVAAALLERWQEDAGVYGVVAPPPLPRRVVIDDIQDLPLSARALLRTMANLGVQIVMIGNPQETVTAFRGGVPELGEVVAADLRARTVALTTNHRNGEKVLPVVEGVAQWFSPVSPAEERKDPQSEEAGEEEGEAQRKESRRAAALMVDLTPTVSQMHERIAAILRRHHLHGDAEWVEMAVIVRHTDSVDAVQRALAARDIPLRSGERGVVLSKVPVCAALLELLAHSDEAEGAEQDRQAMELATSALVRADPLGIYRIHRDFRAVASEEGRESGIASMLEAIDQGAFMVRHAAVRDTMRRLKIAARLWRRRKEAAELPAEQGLWLLWETAGIAAQLRQKSFAVGSQGRCAHEELDAVLALFRKADLWQQAQLESHGRTAQADVFARELLGQSIATDSLVPRGLGEKGVAVMTPTQAAGRQWKCVVVAGVQEGTWPASRQTRMGSIPRLTSILTEARLRGWQGREPIGQYLPDPGVLADVDAVTLGTERRIEEARLFYEAVSRPSDALHIVAVDSEEEAPSSFLSRLVDQGVVAPMRNEEGGYAYAPSERSLTLDSLVSSMRRVLADDVSDEEEKKQAARVLALLWGEGVVEANPGAWGITGHLSSDSPILDVAPLRIGPSTLQEATDCPLRWFLGSIHGKDQELRRDASQLGPARIGTIIHRLAEEHPRGGPDELEAALEQYWEEMELGDATTWARRAKADMTAMVRRMGEYFQSYKGEVLTEEDVRFALSSATISGRADRIEIMPDGCARIVDIKTGNVGSLKSTPDNLQLAAYQIGITEMGYQTGGAALLALKGPSQIQREQAPFSPEDIDRKKKEFDDLALRLSGTYFVADPIKGDCLTCPFTSICPAKANSTRSSE